MPRKLLLSSVKLSLVFALVFSGADSFGQQAPVPSPPPDAQSLVVDANQLYKEKQYDRAIELATKAVQLLPKDHRPWAIIGNCYLAQWKMKSASEAYVKAAAINPRLKGLWYLKAYADRRRNAREESIAAARRAIEIDPNFAEAYIVLGQSLGMSSKDTKGALEAYRTAYKLRPDMVEAAEEFGSSLRYHGDKKGAEEVYRRALKLDPNGMACRFLLGRLLVEEGRLVEAREIWNGRKYDEKDTFPLFIVLLERAEKKKAVADKLAAAPSDPQALLAMGFMELEGDHWVVDGRQRRAIEYFRKALAKNADLAQAQFGICKAFVEIADHEKSANADLDLELKKLRDMDPKLAGEIDEYRKTYSGGFKVGAVNPNDQ